MIGKCEYFDRFDFITHIQTDSAPVAQSCLVGVSKFSKDSIAIEFDTNTEDAEPPTVFIDITKDGIPCVQLYLGTEERQVLVHLIDGNWVVKEQST